MTIIKADRVRLGYNGRSVVNDLSLSVHPGELLGLIGPNGVGKTTILRALAGLLQPKSGVVLLNDQDLRKLNVSTRAKSIGLVPQGETDIWPLQVKEVVKLGRAPHRGWLKPFSRADHEAIDRALQITGLSELSDRPINKLSGGERQRVIVARALAQEPNILLLDEPTANLDVRHQNQLLDLVRELVSGKGLSAILAIHDLTLAARYCDRLVLMNEGREYATGSPEEVLTADNLRAVYGVDAELYLDPRGQWALSIRTAA